jgi:ABC-type antimicrobial peptide transport system permease subunit
LGGVVLGGVAGFAMSQLLAGILYGVRPWDPAIYLIVVALLAAVAGIACGVPAWRASRTEPVAVLRLE